MCFYGLFWAEMTRIDIQNPKLIVTNDFQQFLAHFEWFLSLFQISEVNGYCCSSIEKYAKMVLFGLKTHFKIFFLGYFYPPTLSMPKNWVKIVPKQVFRGAGIKRPPYGSGCI